MNPWKKDPGRMGAVSTFGAAQTAITIGAGATYPFDTVRRRLQMQSEKPVEVAGPPGDGDGGWESLETRPKMTGFLPCELQKPIFRGRNPVKPPILWLMAQNMVRNPFPP